MQKMFTIGWRTNWRAGDAKGERVSERRETERLLAERMVREALAKARWREIDLATQPKGHRLKVRIAQHPHQTRRPHLFIEAVPSSVGLADKLRNQVEIIRQQKRVREIDIE
jgi:hypothetical protein